jgi:hypothetical protein
LQQHVQYPQQVEIHAPILCLRWAFAVSVNYCVLMFALLGRVGAEQGGGVHPFVFVL